MNTNRNKNEQEEEQAVETKKYFPLYQWNAKCARYLAYAVDGGIFCSQFTLQQMLNMMQKIEGDGDEIIIRQ